MSHFFKSNLRFKGGFSKIIILYILNATDIKPVAFNVYEEKHMRRQLGAHE